MAEFAMEEAPVLLAEPAKTSESSSIAANIFRRCPTVVTPSSFKSSAVSFGRTASSI